MLDIKNKKKFHREAGIYPIKTKHKVKKIFGFDTETFGRFEQNDNQGFLFGSIIGDDYKQVFFNKDEWEELLHNQIFRSSFVCATNLAFDLQSIYSCFSKMPIEEMLKKYTFRDRAGSIIFAYTYVSYDLNDKKLYSKNALDKKLCKLTPEKRLLERKKYYKITFIDSISHLQSSVKNLGKIIGIEKMESPKRLGRRPIDDIEYFYTLKYNINDSLITFTFMKWLQNEYNKLGAELKVTISSTSLDLFRRKYLKKFIPQESKDKIEFQQSAYYGGRTETFIRGRFTTQNFGKIKAYDINSLYPFILSTGIFPYTKSFFAKNPSINHIKNFEGIAEVECFCPSDLHIPILPVRHDNKLIFPVGLIKGCFSFIELRYALTLGYKILKIKRCLVYENKFNPFSNFILDLYKFRIERKKSGDSSELIPKILMNSFYGKMGYRYDNKEELMLQDDIKSQEEIDSWTNFYSYHNSKIIRICKGKNNTCPSYVMPIISLYVTSQARIHMHKLFNRIGYENIIYTDTDSIYTVKNVYNSLNLGDLKLEHTIDDIVFIKAKMYGSKEFIKVKGLSKFDIPYSEFIEILKSGNITKEMTTFTKLRGSLIRNKKINSVYKITKVVDLNDSKRYWNDKNFSLDIQHSKPLIFTQSIYRKWKSLKTKTI